jgi:hypothetical protein
MYPAYWKLRSDKVQITPRTYDGHAGFLFTAIPEVVSEYGGPRSPRFYEFASRELARNGLCLSGYEVLSESSARESYQFTGVCKAIQ